MSIKSLLREWICGTPLQYIPVTVKKGLARGAKWTLFPFSAYWRGNTEMDIEAAIRCYGSIRGMTCWDLGAHFGIYTVGMAMAVGSEGQVVGFEPNPVSFDRCKRHVQMNSLNWAKLYNAAASDSDDLGKLFVGRGSAATTSHFAYEDETCNEKAAQIQVKKVIIDHLVERGEIRPPDFVKVDVEGHGAHAIKGASRTIARHRPIIVMSFHSEQELAGTRAILEPLGYCSFSCDGKEIGWSPSLYKTTVLRSKRSLYCREQQPVLRRAFDER